MGKLGLSLRDHLPAWKRSYLKSGISYTMLAVLPVSRQCRGTWGVSEEDGGCWAGLSFPFEQIMKWSVIRTDFFKCSALTAGGYIFKSTLVLVKTTSSGVRDFQKCLVQHLPLWPGYQKRSALKSGALLKTRRNGVLFFWKYCIMLGKDLKSNNRRRG